MRKLHSGSILNVNQWNVRVGTLEFVPPYNESGALYLDMLMWNLLIGGVVTRMPPQFTLGRLHTSSQASVDAFSNIPWYSMPQSLVWWWSSRPSTLACLSCLEVIVWSLLFMKAFEYLEVLAQSPSWYPCACFDLCFAWLELEIPWCSTKSFFLSLDSSCYPLKLIASSFFNVPNLSSLKCF